MIDYFVDLTRKDLALIDGLPGMEAKEFLHNCAILLPQIYSLAQQLPEGELPEDSPSEINFEELQSTRDGIESPMGRIMDVLKGHDLYYEVFDPVNDRDALSSTLSDDLSDIYTDLRRPLIKYDSSDEANQRSAIWDWKFTFQIHWGRRLVDAMRPIHKLMCELGSEENTQ